MTSELIRVADAVVAALNVGAFSMPFTAERHYQPVFDLAEMKDLHVSVVPRGREIAQAARTLATFDCKVDVAVQKKFTTGDAAELDPLMALAEELAEFFRCKRLPGLPDAAWVKTEHSPVYAQDHLQELRQFTSVMTLTFRITRSS
jgi:hypothetical protein